MIYHYKDHIRKYYASLLKPGECSSKEPALNKRPTSHPRIIFVGSKYDLFSTFEISAAYTIYTT